MADIMAEVNHVKKIYRLNIKEPGIKGAFRNLAHAKWTEKTALDDISFQMKGGTGPGLHRGKRRRKIHPD